MARPLQTEVEIETERQRLCGRALALYREKGYQAVTLREIGVVAGVSYTALYRYFNSRDDLFVHVRAQVFSEFGCYLKSRDYKASPGQRLRRVAYAYVEYAEKFPEDYKLIFSTLQPMMDEPSPLKKARQQVVNQVISICKLAVDSGELHCEPRVLAHLLWATLHGLLSLHVSGLLTHGCALNDLVEPALAGVLRPITPTDNVVPLDNN